MSTLRTQLEIFVNRMKSNQCRGRPIANDTAVQTLFMNITAMHTQLLKFIHEQDDKRGKWGPSIEQFRLKLCQCYDGSTVHYKEHHCHIYLPHIVIHTVSVNFERLQDKISQVRDARAALEALREEHRDRVRREREEQERLR